MSKMKLKGTPNASYVAPSGTQSADGNGNVTDTSPEGDFVALIRQGLIPVGYDGRPTAGSGYTPPDESIGLLSTRSH